MAFTGGLFPAEPRRNVFIDGLIEGAQLIKGWVVGEEDFHLAEVGGQVGPYGGVGLGFVGADEIQVSGCGLHTGADEGKEVRLEAEAVGGWKFE